LESKDLYKAMKFVSFLMIALVVMGTALVSVQNAASISIRFLGWQSIELPVGVVLSASFAVGLLLAVGIPLVWRFGSVYDDFDEVAFADSSVGDQDSGQDWD
jgi:uncharacterized integral membrane protein